MNLSSKFGYTLIIFALFLFGCAPRNLKQSVIRGNVEKTKEFIQSGQDVNMKDKEGFTPLFHAARNGHVEVVKVLIKNGAQVDEVNNEMTKIRPIFGAIQGNHFEVVKLLIEVGSDVNKEMFLGATPLIMAIGSKDTGIIKLLLKKGADPDLKNWKGQSAIEVAETLGKNKIAQMLCMKSKIYEESECNQASNDQTGYDKFLQICESPDDSQKADLRALSNQATGNRLYFSCSGLYEKLSKLTKLDLGWVDIHLVLGAKNVRELNIGIGSSNSKDLSLLSKLTKLQKLKITISKGVETNSLTKVLAKLKRLKSLKLKEDLYAKVDYKLLASLKQLNELILWRTGFYNIEDLDNMPNLKKLSLVGNKLGKLGSFKGVPNLVVLNLANNEIDDITSLSKLIHLEELNIRRNKIVDLSPIKNLKKLKKLHAKRNPIEDCTLLKSHPNIKAFSLPSSCK